MASTSNGRVLRGQAGHLSRYDPAAGGAWLSACFSDFRKARGDTRRMEIRSCRQAVVRGLKWLLAQQAADGSIKPIEHGLNTFHKVPYALALTGQLERGSRLCAWLQENVLDEEGDFTLRCERQGPLASFYHYANSWLVMGAHRLGQFGVSLRAAELLATLQHPQTGGFLTMGPESSLDGMQDIMSSAMAGLAMINTGQIATAQAVGQFLVSMYDRQPKLGSQMLFVQQKGDRLVNEWPEGQGQAFALTLRAPEQWYFVPGLAGGFLAKLYEVTGQETHLQAAQNYTQFAESSGSDRYEGPNAWWFGWGAAMVYAVNGVAIYRRIAEEVAGHMVEDQMSNGTWAAGSMGYEPPAPIVDATAEGIIVLTEILQGLVVGE